MSTFEYDVFLSHNSSDKGDVSKLKNLLTTRMLGGKPLRCWLDRDELPPGRDWVALLQRGLENSLSIAACVGHSGIGAWHEEEVHAALVIAKNLGRAVIPVLLPGAPKNVELPPFLQTRTWVDFREGFSEDALDRLVWGITGNKPGDVPAVESGDDTNPKRKPARTEAELKSRLREVFGDQFEAMQELFQKSPKFRELLSKRFGVFGDDQGVVTLNLMYCFHAQFHQAVGLLGRLYGQTSYKGELLSLVSSVLYLALDPDYAEGLRVALETDSGRTILIHREARENICQILAAWTQWQPGVSSIAHGSESQGGFLETTPQMAYSEVRLALMNQFGIRPTAEDADGLLEAEIRATNSLGLPRTVSVVENELLKKIREPGSPLRDLLVFLKVSGASIRPREADTFDRDIEVLLKHLKPIISAR